MRSSGAASIPEIVPKEDWEQEFRLRHAIPSSTRQEPAKALQLFSELLKLGSPMKVLDAGAGNGRNTVYLAERGCQVTALDFADFALEETTRRVAHAGLETRVSIVRHFIDGALPFPENSFDFVLDAYVFCHFLREEVGHRFWRGMARVTKPGGYLLSIVFSTEDEYYAKLLKDRPDESIVCDPANGIWKRLYSEQEIRSFFSRQFEVKYFAKFEFSDCVMGKRFQRVLFISALRKSCS
jgi:ubiquinone/menaquinone biosynthesis C-methylase UbiE